MVGEDMQLALGGLSVLPHHGYVSGLGSQPPGFVHAGHYSSNGSNGPNGAHGTTGNEMANCGIGTSHTVSVCLPSDSGL
ncbi:hypothetical protein PG997_009154 [Apiospora hydei]|uniref:Uncharacterized protein n=1 Tax=Apiospora hydei TaxID=1337664 RepID=A0ABR1VT95_9PEZI